MLNTSKNQPFGEGGPSEQSERGILIIAFYIVALILVSTRFVRL